MENNESEHSHDSCSSSSSSSGSSSRSSRSDDPIPIPVIDSVASCWDHDEGDDKTDDACWTLQIKRVGETEPDFSVTVHPEDPLQRLLEAIGSHTGWSCSEQRLIYRGRLLTTEKSTTGHSHSSHHPNNNNSRKVRDIAGLTDGHTIHLMRKPPPSTDDASIDESNHQLETASLAESGSNSPASSSLLAALLGMGANNNNNNRRVPYRLQESDLVRPDPGSLEAVRQGLLTLHTLQAESRPFYVGQWIDCRDTVNQWLEATVVNIVDPREVLPDLKTDQEEEEENEDSNFFSCRSNSTLPCSSTVVTPTSDPAIAATDLDGRRRLLLQPCEEHEAEERLDGVYYRRRSNNGAVQLLRIHYNGWPVRWDEWIRSDSERIRPFRVRTRHSPQTHASPTVTTPLPDPPRTHFTGSNTEEHDREALLPELYRAVDRVQELLQRAAAAAKPQDGVGGGVSSPHLPWNAASCSTATTASTLLERQSELQTLAPLLDRLGRVLTDAAPHVAALATSLEQQQQQHHDPSNSSEGDEQGDENDSKRHNHNPHTLGGLLSLLSRDRRGHEQSVASSNAAVPSAASLASGNEHGTIVEDEEDDDEDEEEEMPVDPDLSDFRTGFVNSTRGESRRRNSDELASLLGAYLAAASLGGGAGNITTIGGSDGDGADAAEGLGRLLREGNGGGIDIHIHAVVTTPTGATAALFARDPTPRARLLSPPTAATSTFLAPSHAEPINTVEDDGIFAALYSENPEPVNMNGNDHNSEESARIHNQASTGSSSVNNSSTSDHQRRRHRSSSGRRHNNNGPASSTSSSGVLGRFFRRDRSNH